MDGAKEGTRRPKGRTKQSTTYSNPNLTHLLAVRLRQRRVPQPLHVQAEHRLVPPEPREEEGALPQEGPGQALESRQEPLGVVLDMGSGLGGALH